MHVRPSAPVTAAGRTARRRSDRASATTTAPTSPPRRRPSPAAQASRRGRARHRGRTPRPHQPGPPWQPGRPGGRGRRRQPANGRGARDRLGGADALARLGACGARDLVSGGGRPGPPWSICCAGRSTRAASCRSPSRRRPTLPPCRTPPPPPSAASAARPSTPTASMSGTAGTRSTGCTPAFDFGFGLSYTRFRFSGMQAKTTSGGGVTVQATVTNVGPVRGTDVVQCYLGYPGRVRRGAPAAPGLHPCRPGTQAVEDRQVHLGPERPVDVGHAHGQLGRARGRFTSSWVTAPPPPTSH